MRSTRGADPEPLTSRTAESRAPRCLDWVDLQGRTSVEELRRALAGAFTRELGELGFVIVTHTGDPQRVRIEARSSGVELPVGGIVALRDLPVQLGVCAPLRFGERLIGEVRLEGMGSHCFPTLMRQAAAALVHVEKHQQVQRSLAGQACALDAMKSAVGLFGEPDIERMCVGFLQLAMEAAGAAAGAIYLQPSCARGERALELQHFFALPEELLAQMRLLDGSPLAAGLLRRHERLYVRESGTSFGPFDVATIPPALTSIHATRLEYEGQVLGVLLLFNVQESCTPGSQEMSALEHMSLLGGALLHRQRLEEEEIERRKMESEMRLAGQLQKGLLPSKAPNSEVLRFAWRSDPARQVGGDYIDVLEEEDGTISAILADVSGHGVSSALLMTSFRSAYRVLMEEGLPDGKLELMNWTMCQDVGDTAMFITAAAVSIGEDGRSVSFASAGHNDVFVYRAVRDEFEVLAASGPPIGLFPNVSYEGEVLGLETGDLIVLYSDGIVEAQCEALAAAEEQMFGEERLKELIRAHVDASPDALVAAIYAAVETFSRRPVQEDDTSVLVIQAV